MNLKISDKRETKRNKKNSMTNNRTLDMTVENIEVSSMKKI